jgi:5-methylcytosine-specific restriction endonuclease McrA
MLAEVDPELARPSERMRAFGNGRWELKATVDAECRHGLEKLQMLLSHRDPHLTLGGLVWRLVRDGLDRYDPARPRRARRTGVRGSAMGERTMDRQDRRHTEAAQGSVAPANGGSLEHWSEVERDDASPAAVRGGAPRPSTPKRHTVAKRGGTQSAAVRDTVFRTTPAAKRPAVAEPISAPAAAYLNSGGHGGQSASPAKHQTAERDRVASAVAQDGRGGADSAATWGTAAVRGGAKSAPVGGIARCTDSAAKRAGQDEDAYCEETAVAKRCGAPNSAPGRRREEVALGAPEAVRGSGGAGSLAKGQGRLDDDDRGEEKCSVMGRATCAAEPNLEAGERRTSWAVVRGSRRSMASVAERLAYAAGNGAADPAGRSPGLERHLAALSCFGTLPGSRSRYIAADVKREVWRRDQGCCSYVHRHSGRRCGSRYRLEIDHIVPFALGGVADLFNLRLRCLAHHKLRHAQVPRRPGKRAD